jgi:cell division control protein 24
LQSLIKATPKDEYPWYNELVEGLGAAKRITDKINEAQRRAENLVAVENLRDRVEDWKGHSVTSFGELILDDIFMVTKSDVDREYHVFMFDKIILCCKEVASMPMSARKMSKSNSILKKSVPVPPTPTSLPGGVGAPKMKSTPLLLKGRIFLTNVTQAVPSRTSACLVPMTMLIHRLTGVADGYSLAVWWSGEDDMEYFTLRCRTEEQMVKWENAVNRLIKDVAEKRDNDRLSDSRARSIAEPLPQPRMPNTYYDRNNTMSTMSMSGRSGSSAGRARPVTPFGEDFVSGNYSRSNSDNFFAGDDDDDAYSPALNAAPSGRGTPLGGRRFGSRTPVGYNEDARQSNYSTGTPPIPPVVNGLPAGPASRTVLSRPSISRLSSTASGNSSDGGGMRRGGLRSQLSSNRLNSAYGDGGNDSRSSMPARPIGANGPAGARSRSASNPQAYVPRQAQPPPPLPSMGNWAQQGPAEQQEEDGSKRGSGSSQSTQHSSDFSNNGGASSPATPYASSDGSLNAFDQPIKVKVHFNEDIFVVHVTARVEFAELVEKVGKKIRLCGPRRDDGPLRVKYRDEDGDMVSLGSTEDVQMAFESVRAGGQVVLFVA